MEKNIFVLGLDDFHLRWLRTVREAQHCRFHALFQPREIVHRLDFEMEELLNTAKHTLDSFAAPKPIGEETVQVR